MAGQGVTLNIEALEEKAKEIAEIDAKLASANGNEKQARKAVIESLAAENSEAVDALLTKILDQLAKQDTGILVALSDRFAPAFIERFTPQIDDVVNAKVAETTSSLSKEEVAALREGRKTKVNQFRAIKDILDSVGMDTSAVQEPKRSGGGGGGRSGGGSAKTGKNREGYQYTMDGKDRPVSQNTLSSLAYYATPGCPKATGASEDDGARWGTAELKEFIAGQGVNYPEQDEWEITLPNNRKIGARRMAAEAEAPATTEAETPAAETPAA